MPCYSCYPTVSVRLILLFMSAVTEPIQKLLHGACVSTYSPKGRINRPRMNQDVMLCGRLLHQILPDIHTTLHLKAVL